MLYRCETGSGNRPLHSLFVILLQPQDPTSCPGFLIDNMGTRTVPPWRGLWEDGGQQPSKNPRQGLAEPEPSQGCCHFNSWPRPQEVKLPPLPEEIMSLEK